MAYGFNDDKSKLEFPLPIENGGTGAESSADALAALGIQTGRMFFDNLRANTYRDVNVTFSQPYTTAPNVVPGLNTTSTAWQSGRISVSALNITNTGFTCRVYNADSVTRAPSVAWIAIGAM